MLLWSISKQFLKKLIPGLAVVMVVLGCLGFSFKQEREAQTEYRKNLEQVNEKYKNYKNGKEYVDDQLNKISKESERVIKKCIEKDDLGVPVCYKIINNTDVDDVCNNTDVDDVCNTQQILMRCNENMDHKSTEEIELVKRTVEYGIKSLDDGTKMMGFVYKGFDDKDNLIYQQTTVCRIDEEIFNLECDQDITYGEYLEKLRLQFEELIDNYDDMVEKIDANIKILEAYGLREKDKSA